MGKNEFLILCNLILSQFIIILIGYPVVLCIFRRKHNPPPLLAKISLAYGVGTAIITLEMLFLAFCKIPFSFKNILLPWIFTHPMLFWMSRRRKYPVIGRPPQLSTKMNECNKGPVNYLRCLVQLIVIMLILLQCYCFTIYTFSEPLYEWDEFTNWALKAKICYVDKTIPVNTFEIDKTFKYRHDYYPLLVPLAQTWVYINLGNANDWLGKVIFPLFFSFLIYLFYYLLRELFFSQWNALLFTLFLITNGVRWVSYSTISIADLPMEFYYSIGVLCLYVWISFPDRNEFLILSSILSGASLWTKVEGIPMVAINIFILICYCLREKGRLPLLTNKMTLLSFAIILLFFMPWRIYHSSSGVSFTIEHINQLRLERSYLIIRAVLKDMGCTFCWGIIWYVFIISLCLNIKNIFSTRSIYLLGTIFLNILFIAATYLVTQHEDIGIQIDATLRRLLLHIIPLIVFFSGIQIKEMFKNYFQLEL